MSKQNVIYVITKIIIIPENLILACLLAWGTMPQVFSWFNKLNQRSKSTMMGLWSDGCQKFEIFWGFRMGLV